MFQILPLLTLKLFRTLYEESTPWAIHIALIRHIYYEETCLGDEHKYVAGLTKSRNDQLTWRDFLIIFPFYVKGF